MLQGASWQMDVCVCVCVCVCARVCAHARTCALNYVQLLDTFSRRSQFRNLTHLFYTSCTGIHQCHLVRLTNSYGATKITWSNICILLAMEHFIDFAQITSTSFFLTSRLFSRDLKLSISQEQLADSPTARAMWCILSIPESNILLSEI